VSDIAPFAYHVVFEKTTFIMEEGISLCRNSQKFYLDNSSRAPVG